MGAEFLIKEENQVAGLNFLLTKDLYSLMEFEGIKIGNQSLTDKGRIKKDEVNRLFGIKFNKKTQLVYNCDQIIYLIKIRWFTFFSEYMSIF